MSISRFRSLPINGFDVAIHDEPMSTLDMGRYIAAIKSDRKDVNAFAVVNLEELVQRVFLWRKELPYIEPYYAVKANDDKILLQVLAALNVGFDCASKWEIEQILNEGIASSDRIIYAHPCKPIDFIKFASNMDVKKMTFDNESELYKIKEFHKNPELLLRISASDPTAQTPIGKKYGCDPIKLAQRLLEMAKVLDIKVIGISFHVGSGCNNPAAFEEPIQNAQALFEFGKNIGHNMHVLDIGGGFPGTDKPNKVSFTQIADMVRNILDTYFPNRDEVKIIAEPGRYFATSPISIVTNVISIGKVPASQITKDDKDENDIGFYYYINDGVYGSFNGIFFDNSQPRGKPLFENEVENNIQKFYSSIWGPTCAGNDLIEEQTYMPQLKIGDWLYYPNMGSYSRVCSTRFNGFEQPTYYYFIKSSILQELFYLSNDNKWIIANGKEEKKHLELKVLSIRQG